MLLLFFGNKERGRDKARLPGGRQAATELGDYRDVHPRASSTGLKVGEPRDMQSLRGLRKPPPLKMETVERVESESERSMLPMLPKGTGEKIFVIIEMIEFRDQILFMVSLVSSVKLGCVAHAFQQQFSKRI